MNLISLFTLLLVPSLTFAAGGARNDDNLIAVGQGISSPTLTTTVNFSSGYTHESPIGTIYQNSFRVTGEYDTSNDNDSSGNRNSGSGAELGYGTGHAGLAAGYYKRNCNNCDGKFAGAAAVAGDAVGAGLRYEKDILTIGLLFNPNGMHRFGLIGEVNDSGGSGAKVTTYGAGYAHVGNNWTFAIDASKRNYENSATYADRMMITPGVSVRADFLQLTLNDKIILHDRQNDNVNDERTKHEVWFGVGGGGASWHLVGYSKYVNDVALAFSFFF